MVCFGDCPIGSKRQSHRCSYMRIPKAFCGRGALWATAIAVIGSFFLPQIVWIGSYVIHGGAVAYKQFGVPIPSGWTVHPGDNSLMFMRMPISSFGKWGNDYVFVSEFQYPKDRTFEYERWKKTFVQVQEEHGRTLLETIPSRLISEQSFCLVFVTPENSRDQWIDCQFPDSQLSIGFQGERAHSGTLYSLIAGITANN